MVHVDKSRMISVIEFRSIQVFVFIRNVGICTTLYRTLHTHAYTFIFNLTLSLYFIFIIRMQCVKALMIYQKTDLHIGMASVWR